MASIKIVMVEPEIPGNTGNIIRLCANTGTELHLIGPLGFFLDNREMIRAGLDYKEFCSLRKYVDWDEFWKKESPNIDQCYAFTTKAKRSAFDIKKLEKEAWLFFGAESKGLSGPQKKMFYEKHLLRIPMVRESRSLNLSNSVAVVLYKFLQVNRFVNGDNKLI
ncbi:MAG: tRNA (cytidine(34)-2'-O)-methyltransferase [Burkholderiaceae bacterium]